MDDAKLLRALNILGAQVARTQCQVLALRGLITTKGYSTDAEFDRYKSVKVSVSVKSNRPVALHCTKYSLGVTS